jgi:parallel beta-helix repeat protein
MIRRIGLATLCLIVYLATPARLSTSVSAQTNDWVVCATEGGTCAFTGTTEVRYGANGSYVYKTLTDGTACTNSVFGDPAVGTPKQCAIKRSISTSTITDWTTCALENGTCIFTGSQEVRYGANGSYVYKTLTDGTACTNSVFGDPAVGTAKECAIERRISTNTDWVTCALEGGMCVFTGTMEVRYGANGLYAYKTLTDGTVCTNSVFGDPAAGMPKECAIKRNGSSVNTNWTLCGFEGGFCAFDGTTEVRYGANGSYVFKTLTGGVACTNGVFGDPAVGAPKQCHINPAIFSSPPSSPLYGPTTAITCPADAVDLWPGLSRPELVSLQPGGRTYCVRRGVHYLTSSIEPHSGDTFVGEHGAILDGAGWRTNDSTQAAFRAHNRDVDDVIIRNLVIRNMPQDGIHAFTDFSDRWTIERSELVTNKTGIMLPNHAVIRNNFIHHNFGDKYSFSSAERGGGFIGYFITDVTFDSNEIAYNGTEQKVMDSANVIFRNNFVHHNVYDGIWYDGGNPGALVEGNRVEDNGRGGIFYEAGSGAIIRNNTVRRSGEAGVVISTSQNVQVRNNTLEGNFGGVFYFINCGVTGDARGLDLKNVAAEDNTVRLGTRSGALGSGLSYTPDCTPAQLALYLGGTKNLTFVRNTYYVPGLTGPFDRHWLWGDQYKYWNEWQGVGNDLDGHAFQP